MNYYISDCHFDHKNLLERMDKRKFNNVDEMNEFMIRQWNKRVGTGDNIYILGDLFWSKDNNRNTAILKRLRGKKHLILGNHDNFVKKQDFDKSLFEEIVDYKEVHDNGKLIICSHFPIMCYNKQYHGDKNMMFHGHIHNTYDQILVDNYVLNTRKIVKPDSCADENRKIPCNIYNVFCMYSNYTPWSADEWITYHENRLSIRRD